MRTGVAILALILALASCLATWQTGEPVNLPGGLDAAGTATPIPAGEPSSGELPSLAEAAPVEVTETRGAPTSLPQPSVTLPRPSPTSTRQPYLYVFPVRPLKWVDYVQGHAGYPATDIFAPEGYEFLAVTDGWVDFASPVDLWDAANDDPAARGGIAVAIIGDDGVRYYGSHLLRLAEGIEPGVRVTAGQVLGYVGMTGNAGGTLPHVHFAISPPTTPEDWKTRRGVIDPYPYLEAWRRGESLTPQLTPTP